MKQLNLLHIASFSGNVGDNASHKGLNTVLKETLPSFHVRRREIRKYYNNYDGSDKQRFDENFINDVNHANLTIIGGGGFLDYWVPGSPSGTTFSIAPERLKDIARPLIISSVGCNPHREIPEGNIARFRAFLTKALDNPNIKIAFRNDGSVNALARDIGTEFADAFPELADNGFFYEPPPCGPDLFNHPYVAINIAPDQMEMHSGLDINVEKETVYKDLSKVIQYITEHHDLDVVLVPHIYQDLDSISALRAFLPEHIIRNRVQVAPCVQGDHGSDVIFSIYKNSQMVIGTRYHANVCPLAMGRPTIGLVALNRVKHIYDQLEVPDRALRIDQLSADIVNPLIDRLLSEASLETTPIKSVESLKARTRKWYKKALSSEE